MNLMTEQDKSFITTLIDGVKESIKSIKELFEEKIETIRDNQGKFRVDIIDLYEKYRLIITALNASDNKIIALQTELKNHKTNHAKEDTNNRSKAGIIASYVIGGVSLIAGILIAIFGG